MSADRARSEAIKVIGDLEKGIHPQEAKRKSENEVSTLGELFNRYVDEYLSRIQKAWAETEKSFARHCVELGKRELAHLTRSDIQRWVNKIGTDVGMQTADRNFNTIRACLRWGIRQDLCSFTSDPTTHIKLFRVKPKKEILLKPDWKKVKAILDNEPQHIQDIIYMHIFTAARKSNVLQMEWKEIHMAGRLWTIPPRKSKNGKENGDTTHRRCNCNP